MPDGTVRGSFELSSEQAVRGLHEIRDAGREADAALEALGTRMDTLSRKKATPTIELRGFDRINAQLTELELRLDRLDRRRVSPSVGGGGFGGLASNVAGAGGGGGAQSSTSSVLSSIPAGGMIAGGLALSPGILGLAGGATALVGSAGSAALGGGTVALGGLGPLVAGLGATAIVAKPAVAGLQAIIKAQQAYTLAVQQYGQASSQAATADARYKAQLATNPGAGAAARQVSGFRSAFQASTTAARGQVFRGITNVVSNARGALPSFGGTANVATNATAGAAGAFSGFLTDPTQLATLRTLTLAFANDLPPAERALENITSTLGHLSVAAIPFFHEADVWVQTWTAGLATSTSNTAEMQTRMQDYVNSARDWAGLAGAAFRTIRDIFSAGAPTGDSMVQSLTDTLDRWDTFIRDNPQKVQAFFHQAETTTSNIAQALVGIVRDIAQLANLLTPIFNRATEFLGFVSGAGPGGLGIAGAALFGGYEGLRGGRGPSAGALAGAFVTGGAGRGLMRGGAGALGAAETALVAGGGGLAGRASMLVPRTAAGIATPEAFAASIGGMQPGARFAGPLSELGARASLLSRLTPALETAAKFALPVLGIMSVLQGAQTPGGVGSKVTGTLGAFEHLATFGLVSPTAVTHAIGGAATGTTLAAQQPGLTQLAAQAGAVRTPGQLRTIQEKVRFGLTFGAGEESPADQQKIAAYLRTISQTAASNAGAAASNTWQQSFTEGLTREGPSKATAQMLKGVPQEIKQLGPAGSKAFLQNTATWVSALEQSNPKLRAPLDRLMRSIVADANRAHDKTLGVLSDIRDQSYYFNGQVLAGVDNTWSAIQKSLVNKASVAQEKLQGIFGQIQAQAINALTQMGYSRNQAATIVHDTAKGGQSGANAAAAVTATGVTGQPVNPLSTTFPKHERGGQISGTGLLDTVMTPDGGRAAPGEAWIANRHTMNALSSATLQKFGKTAWQMIRDETRPHSAPMFARGGLTGSAGATGGYVYPIPGYRVGRTDMGVDASASAGAPILAIGDSTLDDVVPNWYAGQPLLDFRLTSGPAAGRYWYVAEQISPVSQRRGAHFRAGQAVAHFASSGTGIEIGWGAPHGQTLAQATTGYSEGQETSAGKSFAAFLSGLAHGRLVAGGPGFGMGGMGGRAISLRAPRSGLAGIPGAMVDQGSRTFAAGLQGRLNRLIGGAGVGGAFTGTLTGSVPHEVAQFMGAAGFNRIAIAGMLGNAMQESSMNPNTPGGGLWQQISNFGQGTGGTLLAQMQRMLPQIQGLKPALNAASSPGAAAQIFEQGFERAGIPAMANRIAAAQAAYRAGYGRGGHVNWAGWNARGGSFVTDGPTMFGAGERGKERVTVTPVGHGGGRSIMVHMEHVHLGGGAPDELEAVAQDVASRILDALERSGDASDADLIGAGS